MSVDSSMMDMMQGLVDSSATALSMSYSSFSNLLSIAIYIFTALALYTIAKRRFVPHAWLAWVPFLQFWIIGSVADNYRWSVHHEFKNRRKVMLVMWILMIVCVAVIMVGLFKMLIDVINAGITTETQVEAFLNTIASGDYGKFESLISSVLNNLLIVLLSFCAMGAIGIVFCVFYYIALYDLYRSCSPENAVLYLVLGILFSFAMPIFLMICRKKDDGMRPAHSFGMYPNT